MNTEHQFLAQGIAAGANANQAIADVVASKTAGMLADSLTENFEVILQAKLSAAVTETLAIHTAQTKSAATKFLNQAKHTLAQSMVDAQHNHRMASIATPDLSDLSAFDCDLNAAVAELADASGTITIEASSTVVGF